KQALLKVGCFDESIKIAGGEDPGLCFKLANEGYKLLYNPDAIIVHDFQRGVVNFIKTFYRYGFGCSAQSKKYFKKISFVNNEKFAGMDK
ncbi:MAG: glycosyltransferase family 2 protein, partial [Patescibacteria group bacterium]